MNKYVIKNCPMCCNGECPDTKSGYCEDKTDCLLKQIVEKCNYYQKKIGRTSQHRAGFVDATRDILQLLEIQEVE